MTWFTLLASVLILFAGRLAPLQLPQTIERTFISLQSHVQNETPAKIESTQQLRVSAETPNQPHQYFSALLPPFTQISVSHPYHYEKAEHPTLQSRLLQLQPRSRSPPLPIA